MNARNLSVGPARARSTFHVVRQTGAAGGEPPNPAAFLSPTPTELLPFFRATERKCAACSNGWAIPVAVTENVFGDD
jgi:hypothetical protein